MKYERETSNLLRCLGSNNSYKGFRYTSYGVGLDIHDPELLTYISKGLYVEISSKFHTSIYHIVNQFKRTCKFTANFQNAHHLFNVLYNRLIPRLFYQVDRNGRCIKIAKML